MKMTPGTYCLHFQLSHTAGYSHFSQTYSSISGIMWMFLWTLRGPSLYSFPVWWKKAGLLTQLSPPVLYIIVTLPAAEVFGNVLFTSSAAKGANCCEENIDCFIYLFIHLSICVLYTYNVFLSPFFCLQLSSRRSTLIKIWSTCTPSWTSASSPDWRWAPIHSCSPLSPDQWAA